MATIITIEELKSAYLKYKSYLYYDTTELFQREQLAKFESNKILFQENDSEGNERISTDIINSYFDLLILRISSFGEKGNYLEVLINNTDIILLPKKFKSEDKTERNYITNKREKVKYEIEKITAFIQMNWELHLICVLWIMKYGYKLDALMSRSCIGNRLILTPKKDGIANGRSLYKPYHKQYQRWRDSALDEAKRCLNEGEDVSIINLDIKDYYYSVRLDFSKIESQLKIESDCNIHKIFKLIHEKYTKLIIEKHEAYSIPIELKDTEKENLELESKAVILPIGLVSSYVLGNWYLKEFDNRIEQLIRPKYYGRYVDDIIMVFSGLDRDFHKKEECQTIKFNFNNYDLVNGKYSEATAPTNEELHERVTLVERFILEVTHPVLNLNKNTDSGDSEFRFGITCINGCYIQTTKTLLYHFDKGESVAVLDKLKQEMEERASEFRDFPLSQNTSDSFNENAYHLIFDGTEGKIRTLKDYKENRYGLSVYLAKQIFLSLRIANKKSQVSDKILKIFKGQNCFEYFRLWEKIFTYFAVDNDINSFMKFYDYVTLEISKISSFKEEGTNKIAESLKKYLEIAVEMVYSLNPGFLQKQFKDRFENKIFLRSNLIRKQYNLHSILIYTSAILDEKDYNLISLERPIIDDKIELNDFALTYSPTRITLWEACSYLNYSNDHLKDLGNNYNDTLDIYEKIFKIYHKINSSLPEDENFLQKLIKKTDSGNNNILINEIFVNSDAFKRNPKIALVNMRINEENLNKRFKKLSTLNEDFYNKISQIINSAIHEKADVLIFPECSIPYELVNSLARKASDEQILMVFGIEHLIVQNIAYNFIVTILPFIRNNVKDSLVIYRLKNHYSPDEKKNYFFLPSKLAQP